jgi:uncharacterized membrane protein
MNAERSTARAKVQPLGARKRAALVFVFAWFFIGGLAHFIALRTEMSIVPPWIPWPRAAVLISGGLELIGAIGLLSRRTRPLAGIGLFVLTIAVTPANVFMVQHHELFRVPYWLLVARLPLQIGLLFVIAWSAIGQAWLKGE